MTKTLISSVLALALSGPLFAGDADRLADDIVGFMLKEQSKTRAICIGTEAECAEKRRPKGLDMLVTFELNSADLTAEAQESLAVFAEALKDTRLAQINFLVEGHTDARGTDTLNTSLSEARAASVKAYLTEVGVPQDRLKALGLGKNQPRTEDPLDPENRRVELRIDLPKSN